MAVSWEQITLSPLCTLQSGAESTSSVQGTTNTTRPERGQRQRPFPGEDHTRSYGHRESSSGAAFPKGSEEVTHSNKAVANPQMVQSRKAIRSNLSNGVC